MSRPNRPEAHEADTANRRGPVPGHRLGEHDGGPDARISARESVALAFMVVLQELPPLQRAVLLLRDVMGWSAEEVASLLDRSVPSVNSALQRARETCPTRGDARASALDPSTSAMLTRYVQAWEARDATALTSLLQEDARLTMPPTPAVVGRAAIRQLLEAIFGRHDDFRVLPIPVSGGPGFAACHRARGDALFRPHLVQGLDIGEDGITGMNTYLDVSLFPRFGLPAALD
jgi:RNA polymerase sigma-70 factor (ECF subfamily)